MLKITILDSASELRFRLEGKLSGPWVSELRQCWQTAASTTTGRGTVADLREVDFVDPDGQQLLCDMHHAGVRLQAVTPLIRNLVEEICRSRPCATVEETPKSSSDAVVRAHSSGSHSSPL
jgi:anti-anti-sigma regulatory factor